MTDKEIIKAMECLEGCDLNCRDCPYSQGSFYPICQRRVAKDALNLINRQQEQLEAAIAGQETLQKALAEKGREVERLTAEKEQLIKTFGECQAEATKALVEKDKEIKRLKNNVFCSVVIDEGKMRNIVNEKVAEFELDIESIKSEAIKEFAERLKEEQSFYDGQETRIYLTEKDLDNLVKEMVGDAEWQT